MRDIDQALEAVREIRGAVAQGAMFQGFGPAVIGVTGLLALGLGAAQSLWPETLAHSTDRFLALWLAAAILAATMIAAEMIARAHRAHGGMANAMLYQAMEAFAPSAAAGALLGFTLWSAAPDLTWLLPGLWSILVSIGLSAAARNLPDSARYVSMFYFAAGFIALVWLADLRRLDPLAMALPFGFGQLGFALSLHLAEIHDHE